MNSTKYFKGWAVPGAEVPAGIAPAEGETLDALCGHFKLFQLKAGHRFSTDDLLVAWYGSAWCPSGRRVLDLGSGIGTVASLCAWRMTGARFVTVEAQEVSVTLARKSIAYNGIAARFDVRQGDFRDAQVLDGVEPFDLITGSPPYFPLGTGIEGDHPQKVACRFETRGDIGDYCQIAAQNLAAGGVFACIFPIQPAAQRDRVMKAAAAAQLRLVRERPVVLREGEAPLLGLFLLMRRQDLPESFEGWQEPALIIRTQAGRVHPEYQSVKLSLGFPP